MNNDKIDFAAIRAIAFDVDGVLSPSTIPLGLDGEPMRMVNIKDGYAMQLAVKMGLDLCIITGARPQSIEKRYSRLGMTDIYLGAADKLPIFYRWVGEKGLQRHEVAYVGDDIPDLQVLKAAGLAIAPADAAPEVLEVAHYITPCAGGMGVARDVIEQILKARNQWLDKAHAFGW